MCSRAFPGHLPNGERGNLQAISGPAHLQRHRLWQSMWHRHLLLALALFLGLGLLLSWLLSVRLTRPIRHLAHIADRLGQGDLSARSTLSTSNEIGTLGERINRMAANLDRLLTQHRQLLGDVSHELRTPLARLQMAIELALHDLTSSDSPSSDTTARDRSALAKQRWQRARDQIDHLDRLIEELLLYSRLEAWALPLERASLDASKLTETVIAEVSEQLHPQAVGVSVRYAPWRRPPAASLEASTLYGDARLLARALSNVLRNALQASPPHTEVEVTLTLTPDAWQWTIADRGPGVPEGMREALLRPFVRRALPQASLGAQEGSTRGRWPRTLHRPTRRGGAWRTSHLAEPSPRRTAGDHLAPARRRPTFRRSRRTLTHRIVNSPAAPGHLPQAPRQVLSEFAQETPRPCRHLGMCSMDQPHRLSTVAETPDNGLSHAHHPQGVP